MARQERKHAVHAWWHEIWIYEEELPKGSQENRMPQLMLVLFSARRYRSRVGIENGIRMSRGNQGTRDWDWVLTEGQPANGRITYIWGVASSFVIQYESVLGFKQICSQQMPFSPGPPPT